MMDEQKRNRLRRRFVTAFWASVALFVVGVSLTAILWLLEWLS